MTHAQTRMTWSPSAERRRLRREPRGRAGQPGADGNHRECHAVSFIRIKTAAPKAPMSSAPVVNTPSGSSSSRSVMSSGMPVVRDNGYPTAIRPRTTAAAIGAQTSCLGCHTASAATARASDATAKAAAPTSGPASSTCGLTSAAWIPALAAHTTVTTYRRAVVRRPDRSARISGADTGDKAMTT